MVKKYLILVIFGMFFLYLQISQTIFKYINVNQVVPDFVMIYIIIISYFTGAFEGEIIGFFSGILLDTFSSTLFGFSAFTYTIIGYVYGKLKKTISIDSVMFIMLLVIIATLMKLFFLYVFGYIFKELFIIHKVYITRFAILFFYNIIVTPFLYYLLSPFINKTNQ